jgi:hypothetical protein
VPGEELLAPAVCARTRLYVLCIFRYIGRRYMYCIYLECIIHTYTLDICSIYLERSRFVRELAYPFANRTHLRQHTSAFVSIRQHTSAYVCIRQHTSAYAEFAGELAKLGKCRVRLELPLLLLASERQVACIRIRQHTSACVSIRQHA